MLSKIRFFSSLLLLVLWSGCQSPYAVTAPLVNAPLEDMDPKWIPFAPYLRRAISRVQSQWENELISSRTPLPVGATVTVNFWLSRTGEVSRIEEVKSVPEGVGVQACLYAISKAKTFGPWTNEMKDILGPEIKLTFTFNYVDDQPPKKPNRTAEPAPGPIMIQG